HRTGGNEINQLAEERLLFMLCIMKLRLLSSDLNQLRANELKALTFETGEDLPDQSALHAIRFDHQVSSLHVSFLQLCINFIYQCDRSAINFAIATKSFLAGTSGNPAKAPIAL